MNSTESPLGDDVGEERRCVRFQLIELIEIAIVLGDSPSLSTGGAPMSLGWDPVRRTLLDLDDYEKYRPKKKESRRDLIVSGKKRTKFFLRCGYSLPEIEEAAAISLKYRKQMTITKLLEAPEVMKDAVKNRFASSHEPEPQNRSHRLSRRHSMEPLTPPRREPEVDYPSRYMTPSELLDAPSRQSRFQMSRKFSNFEPETGLMRKLSRDRIESPDLLTIPPSKFERRNSPTAGRPTSPIPSSVPTTHIQLASMDEVLPLMPSRTFSPESLRRNLRRHRSAPLSMYMGLRMPVRTLSPSPRKKESKNFGQRKEVDSLNASPTDINQAPSLPGRARSPPRPQQAPLIPDQARSPPRPQQATLVPGRAKSPPRPQQAPSLPGRARSPTRPQRPISPSQTDTTLTSPTKPCRRLSPPIKLQREVIPSRSS